MNDELCNHLITVAKTGGTITYSEAASMVGLDMSSPDDRGKISGLLCDISRHEKNNNRPEWH